MNFVFQKMFVLRNYNGQAEKAPQNLNLGVFTSWLESEDDYSKYIAISRFITNKIRI